jgi:hypothetical protein
MSYQEVFNEIENYSKKYSTLFEIYEEHFSRYKKPVTFVEIGVFHGGSLEFWKKVLPKGSRIIGIEINKDASQIMIDGVEIFIGDQSNPEFWDTFFEKIGKVDIVLDDGGHTNKQQIVTTFQCLKHINNNGLIVIEDTHFSFLRQVGNPSKLSFINWAKLCVDGLNLRYLNRNNEKYLVETKNLIAKKVHSIIFYESVVIFQIKKVSLPTIVTAGTAKSRISQFRVLDEFELSNSRVTIELKKFISNKKIRIFLSKIIFLKRYLHFKKQNLEQRKYFKEMECL